MKRFWQWFFPVGSWSNATTFGKICIIILSTELIGFYLWLSFWIIKSALEGK